MTLYSKSQEYRKAASSPGYKMLIRVRARLYARLDWPAMAVIETARLRHIAMKVRVYEVHVAS